MEKLDGVSSLELTKSETMIGSLRDVEILTETRDQKPKINNNFEQLL